MENNKASGKDTSKQTVDPAKIKAEREARRKAKVAAKQKTQDKNRNLPDASPPEVNKKPLEVVESSPKKTVDTKNQKKQPKQKTDDQVSDAVSKKLDQLSLSNKEKKIEETKKADDNAKKPLTKAERRAIQEAQRAAKAAKPATSASGKPVADKTQTINKKPVNANNPSAQKVPIKTDSPRKSPPKTVLGHRVKLFSHLYVDETTTPTDIVNSSSLPPAIVRLGVQYASGVVKGCNARCVAFLNALKSVVQNYETPKEKEFGRSFEASLKSFVDYLQACRPVAVSVHNAVKYIRWQITQLPKNGSDKELKQHLLDAIETYVRDQIDKAAEAISITVQEKISDGDVILTFGCSSLIQNILLEAKAAERSFRVVIVDARPHHEGLELLRRLVAKDINCTCVQINAVGFIMPEVTKVLLGAHALLANGYVMSRAGTAQIALIAKQSNVPVLVCCETHKFSERVQTDAFVYNEIGNPSDLVTQDAQSPLANWKSIPHLTPLNLYYDVTPAELVTAVVTEIAILPCTSVPVILRIKPSEVGY